MATRPKTGRVRNAIAAAGRRTKQAFTLTPDQQKVFALTLVTALVGGGGLGSLVDKMRTEEYNGKFAQGAEVISVIESNVTVLQEANGLLQTQLQEAQAKIGALEKEPTTIRQEWEALQGQIAGFQAAWEKKQNHEHKYGDWEDPVQIEGNFVTPQFFQYRKCLICGHAESRSAW